MKRFSVVGVAVKETPAERRTDVVHDIVSAESSDAALGILVRYIQENFKEHVISRTNVLEIPDV